MKSWQKNSNWKWIYGFIILDICRWYYTNVLHSVKLEEHSSDTAQYSLTNRLLRSNHVRFDWKNHSCGVTRQSERLFLISKCFDKCLDCVTLSRGAEGAEVLIYLILTRPWPCCNGQSAVYIWLTFSSCWSSALSLFRSDASACDCALTFSSTQIWTT